MRHKLYTGTVGLKDRRLLLIPMAMLFAIIGVVLIQAGHADTPGAAAELESGNRSANAVAVDDQAASGGQAVRFQATADGVVWPQTTNLPPQPAAVAYGDPQDFNAAGAYAHPGALIFPGRTDYDNQVYKNISAAGGSVLIYLDVIIDGSYGKYHQLLLTDSMCGPAVPRWPNQPQANQWGYLNDFRPGSVLQQKLQCVLEQMVADNPHMAGWFADDVGSRSWYPGISWDSWSANDQQAYRDGAIEITKTFRKVANEHGLMFLVNGTWGAGSLAEAGGGYPDTSRSGNALADGGVVEHHDTSELPYFKEYACSTQWASQSPIAKGKAIMLAISNNASDRDQYAASNCFAYLTAQTEDQYAVPPTPWTSFHSNNLPSKVTGPVQ